MPHTAYIALGSNLGDRGAALVQAIDRIAALPGTRALQIASTIQTEPVGCPPDAPDYLNSAVAIETTLLPADLMRALLAIETELGRRRPGPHDGAPNARVLNAPRTIDLDLLLYDDRVIDSPALTLPHPRMHLRRFVLQPLAEIAADAIHPTTGKTISRLLLDLPE